jgi:2-keto-4-pentenoate hydratase/2-oxohepta-3-ene-1,7-dioic acid hydratase in catechol pathway
MRFITYQLRGESVDRVGVLRGDNVHELPGVTRLIDLLGDDGSRLRAAGTAALEGDGISLTLGEVTLRPPVPTPPSVRDFMTFERHIAGTLLNNGPDAVVPKVWYRQPLFYFSNPASLVGHREDVAMPPGTLMLDFECEVAAVIGSGGSDLTIENAQAAIVGYTILNDWSARDIQTREMQGSLGPSKGKDTATSMGPWLVTADELAPYASGPSFSLNMEVELNGVAFGSDRLDSMGWSFAQMVAYASRGTRLVPGDIVGSGTCANGCIVEKWGREGRTQAPLAVGDVVTLRIEKLGELTNRIVEGAAVVDIGPCHADTVG